MSQITKCAVCDGNGKVKIGNSYIRCKHCGGRSIIASPKVVGYARISAVKKKQVKHTELERDWR